MRYKSTGLFSRQHTLPTWMRCLVVLFAVVQVVAPTWHVCDRGLSSCCDKPAVAGAQQAGRPMCSHCPQPGAAAVGQHKSAPCSGETCLARILESLPGAFLYFAIAVSLVIASLVVMRRSPILTNLALLRLPPSRGPPCFAS